MNTWKWDTRCSHSDEEQRIHHLPGLTNRIQIKLTRGWGAGGERRRMSGGNKRAGKELRGRAGTMTGLTTRETVQKARQQARKQNRRQKWRAMTFSQLSLSTRQTQQCRCRYCSKFDVVVSPRASRVKVSSFRKGPSQRVFGRDHTGVASRSPSRQDILTTVNMPVNYKSS